LLVSWWDLLLSCASEIISELKEHKKDNGKDGSRNWRVKIMQMVEHRFREIILLQLLEIRQYQDMKHLLCLGILGTVSARSNGRKAFQSSFH
jgi:hypothetical protein